MRLCVLSLAALLAPALQGQTPDAAVRRAAATITETDVRAKVNRIAHDSMGGRDTPSPGLELTARYIAREFERIGLSPLGDDGGWFQRYGIRVSEIDDARSTITFAESGYDRIALSLDRDARFVFGAPRDTLVSAPVVLVGGPIGEQPALDPAVVRGNAVVWLAPAGSVLSVMTRALGAAVEAGAALLILAVESDSAFDALPRQTGEIVTADQVGWPPVGVLRESAVIAQYPDAGEQIGELRSASTLAAAPVPGWSVTLRTGFARSERHRVPNVVGFIPGRDPGLRDEFVVITAHFDHVGSRCRGVSDTDRICNGADDNASGTTGLLELAEAFARPDAQPRRSMLFVAVSGEERGLWGSQYFAEHPPVPIDRIVANVNMDHLGRNWPDSIVAIGVEHSDLGATLAEVVGEHAELGIGVLPDQWPGQRIYFRSDHYNFAKQGVPILFFTNGFHADYHAVTDSPDKIDAEKQARVVRLIFYTAHKVADRRQRPAWDPESYRAIVKRKPLGS